MAQEIDIFKAGNMPALDPELERVLEAESNTAGLSQVNSLSLKGKQWMITVDGDTKPLMQRDKDGDEIPVSVFRGIILDSAARRGRNYYKDAYNAAKPQLPDCWSDDGVTANVHAKHIQHGGKCEGCPKSVKGSSTNEKSGADSTACQQYRLICIVPLYQLGEFPPLRQKLSITADYDGKIGEHEKDGWFAFGNYLKFLRSKGVVHTARMVTKIKFDPSVDYAKLLFAAAAFATPEQLAAIRPMIGREDVKALISGAFTPNGKDGERVDGKGEDDTGTPPVSETADQDDEPPQTQSTASGERVTDDGDGGTTIEGTATDVTGESDEERELRELQEKVAARKAAKEAAALEAAKPKETDEERELRELKEKQAARKLAKEIEEKAAREAAAKKAAQPAETEDERELRELQEKIAARKAAAGGANGAKPITKVAAPTDDENGGIILPGAKKSAAAGATAKASTAAPKPPGVGKVSTPAAPAAGKPKSTLDGLLQEWGQDD